ncbi:MAG: FecR family protein [Pseudomonadota bacterium]
MNDEAKMMRTESIEDMAAYWVVRLSSGDCSPEDRFACEAWKRANPANAEAFDRIQSGNALMDSLILEPELQDLIAQAHADTDRKPLSTRKVFVFATAAAAALMVGAITMMLASNGVSPEMETTVFTDVQSYETEIGERSTVLLGDGSRVTLNTDSRMIVEYSENERHIQLERGQGFFEVEKDATRPFVVYAEQKQVVALGTAFDVRINGENAVQVTLIEGLVNVAPVPGATASASAPRGIPDGDVDMVPGDQLIANAAGTEKVSIENVLDEVSWREGYVVFRDQSMPEVVAELNRYRAQNILIADDERLDGLKVSGVFHSGRSENFIRAMEAMHPVEVNETDRSELLMVWRE